MKKIIGIAVVIAATALASPANAQSRPARQPSASKQGQSLIISAPTPTRCPRRKAGFVGAGWGDADTTTGGGSPGYNEMLRNW